MSLNELQPQGFQPELVGYFTRDDLLKFALRMAPHTNKGYQTTDDLLKAISKNDADYDKLQVQKVAARWSLKSGLEGDQLEGVQVWSTVDPNTLAAETIPNLTPIITPVLFGERKQLLEFFRINTKDTPDITEAWFDLPHPLGWLKELPEEERQSAAHEVLANISLGEISTPGKLYRTDDLQGKLKDEVKAYQEFQASLKKRSPLEAISWVNRRMQNARRKYQGDDLSIAQQMGYTARSAVQDNLVVAGGFVNLPHGNPLRSLAMLSSATDLMRADLSKGEVTNRGGYIAEGFAFAEMNAIQKRVVEKVAGKNFEVIYTDGKPMEKYTIPQSAELALMQKRINSRLQGIL